MKNNSSDYLIVTHRVSQHTAEVWVGNLVADNRKFVTAELILTDQANNVQKISIDAWYPAFLGASQGFYRVELFENLVDFSWYSVELHIEKEVVAVSRLKTLPKRIPEYQEKPFTIAFGSCFSNQDDFGQFGRAFSLLCENVRYAPDLAFLVGDQVYVDLGFQSLLPVPALMRSRMRKIYQKNWRDLKPVISKTAVWMLPDDHEYWNDYPFNNLPILALQSLKLPYFRQAWIDSANYAIEHVQQSKYFEVINIGDELSICLADARRGRHAQGFMSDEYFQQLLNWAANLNSVGVLVIQQLLLDELGGGERNLLSFSEQYGELIKALIASGQNIIVLTGDVHYGRVAAVELEAGKQLIEVAASPVSNLRGFFNGLGADVAEAKPAEFPPIPIDGVHSRSVEYDDRWYVSSVKGKRFSEYPKDRTKEHFATLSVSRSLNGQIELSINGWLIRELGENGMLKMAFDEPKVYLLS